MIYFLGICVGILFIVCIALLVVLMKFNEMNTYLVEELSKENHDMMMKANTLSKMEYFIRNYKEGKNPYTILRNLQNLLYDLGDKLESGSEDRDN